MELKELEERLDNIENIDKMDDLKDQMEKKDELERRIQYLNDWEKDLLQERDETFDIYRKEMIKNTIEKNKNERDEKSSQLKKIEADIEEVENARKDQKQKTKEKFTTELQDRKSNNQLKIEKKKSQIKEIEDAIKQINDTIEENKEVLKLKKAESKVYKAAVAESTECIKEARKRNKKMKRLTKEILSLEQENKDIDTILEKMNKKEIEQEPKAEAEEEQKEDVKEEQEQKVEAKEEQESKAEAKEEQEQNTELEEKQEPKAEAKDEQEQKAEVKEDQEAEATSSKIKGPNPQINPNLNTRINSNLKPAQDLNTNINMNHVERTEKKPATINYTVKSIQFTIEGNEPVYHAIVEDKDGNQVDDISIVGFDKIETISQKEADRLYNTKNVYQAMKYYDVNIEKLLVQIDEKYGTSNLKQYEQMIKQVEIKPDHRKTEPLKVNYDFSELYNKPQKSADKTTLKKLKKLAKASAKKEIATYQKAPNLLKVMWKRINERTLALQKSNTQKTEAFMEQNTPKDLPDIGDVENIKQGEHIPLRTARRAIGNLHDDEGFDIDVLTEGMSPENAESCRKYRDSLRVKTESEDKIKETIAHNVKEIMKSKEQESDKER